MDLYVHTFETAEGLRQHMCHGSDRCELPGGAISVDLSGPYASPEEVIDAALDIQASISHDPATCSLCQEAAAKAQ